MDVDKRDVFTANEAAETLQAAQDAIASADKAVTGASDSGNSSGLSGGGAITISDESRDESMSSTDASGNLTDGGDVSVISNDSLDSGNIDKLYETVCLMDTSRRKHFPAGHTPAGVMDQDKVGEYIIRDTFDNKCVGICW